MLIAVQTGQKKRKGAVPKSSISTNCRNGRTNRLGFHFQRQGRSWPQRRANRQVHVHSCAGRPNKRNGI